jgi:hypothetical protein
MSKETIRDALVAVGYEFVQLEPPTPGVKDNWRPDLLAWAADATTTLVPWAVVETAKSRDPIHSEAGLRALARARDMLGTTDHYVVVNDTEWYRADSGLRRLVQVEGPEAPPNGGEGEIADADLVTALLSHELWKAASRTRDRGLQTIDVAFNPAMALELTDFQTSTGSRVRVSQEALWQARRRAIVDFERRRKEAGSFTSHKGVSKAVAQLAGSRLTRDLLDPFCGAGSFVWEAIDYAQDHQMGLNTVLGYDVSQRIADVARSIGSASPVPVEIIMGDSIQADLPLSTCVVSAPPFSLRLQQKHRGLLDGSTTRDGDLVVLDRIVRLLGEGSRAVLHLPVGVTFRSNGEPYRHFLASHFRMAAILGLPSGAVLGSGIRSILMVIEKAEPTDTFIAQLGDDWESQLSPGGAVLEAALAHIDGAQP